MKLTSIKNKLSKEKKDNFDEDVTEDQWRDFLSNLGI